MQSPSSKKLLTAPIIAALLTALVALSFALYTHHAWEDYYITFRSSKNLATGHGLVYNVGDRLHTFTSPLGVLLPAVSYLLTFNSSDAAALWIFRLMSCLALGGTAAFWVTIARKRKYGLLAGVFLVASLATDSKILDFSINGMETAFMMLFLAYALWAHLTKSSRPWLHLGAAWAGLMWTRPDSFIYIAVIAIGFWLFNDPAESGMSRREIFVLYLRAGVVTTALYLPWFLFAWAYYGTPVPHTITAKSGIGAPRTLLGLIQTALQLPFHTLPDHNTLEQTFLPAYYMIGGWPKTLIATSSTVATLISVLWALPFLRIETRVGSFAFFCGHVYLSYFPYFPFPWYLPTNTLLALFVVGSLLAQGTSVVRQWHQMAPTSRRPLRLHTSLWIIAIVFVGVTSWVTWETAREFAAQQKYVENGNRRKIGEWLHEHSKPGDTVFMEPLGYIGYFSGLKTYDFPGMSSREMVAARKKVGNGWAELIATLEPTWLVLRPPEVDRLNNTDPGILSKYYMFQKDFNVAKEVASLDVRGRQYLLNDAHFTVFHRTGYSRGIPAPDITFTSPFPVSRRALDGYGVTLVHAPGQMYVKVPAGARTVSIAYGFPPEAYVGADPTDGAVFEILLEHNGEWRTLLHRVLDPARNPADRGAQQFKADLPPSTRDGDHLAFRTENRQTPNKDWTCWSEPEFH